MQQQLSVDESGIVVLIFLFSGYAIIFIRYKHIKFLYAETAASTTNINRINVLSAVVGVVSLIGISIVASFQVS